ncbi:hypothetical protein [Rhodoligotrophos defluvii]|uniref:hypothetical protein n=1 Tax=Rhodoligotrophos defluvii TaxID=2561934 RepID=UPI0010C9BC6F|nr:hypothetical protein [Rhodoligotrophos defluvii]
MDEYDYSDDPSTTSGEDSSQPVGLETDVAVAPGRAKLVKRWLKDINDSRKHHEAAFKRMKKCQQLATFGADEKWCADEERYTVPILNRHINQVVANLYAKNPTAVVKRKRRLMFQIWDGRAETLILALQNAAMGDIQSAMVVQEVEAVVQYKRMLDKLSKTLELLWDYYTSEQAFDFKKQLKALVRRTKVNGVGYIKMAYQRLLEPRPEIAAQISDVTSQITTIQCLMNEANSGEFDSESARLEELRLLLKTLESEGQVITREGPVFDFPRSEEIIVDKRCRHLKTLAGAQWIAHEFEMTPEEIKEVYKVDVRKSYTKYSDDPSGSQMAFEFVEQQETKPNCARVYEVQDKKRGQVFTVCEGYPDFLKEPAAPDIKLERFFTVFPLVFNECENEKEIYPPSDVWQARHVQAEYNRSREGLREHRLAARPYYVASHGKLEEEDKKRLAGHAAHEIIEVNALAQGETIDKVLQAGPTAPIDPNLYEVESLFVDMLRTVGAQEANLGEPGDSTATASSIAENSRLASMSDNVDDLDDFLTDLAKALGHVMLQELDRETVIEIAGPGAVWPTTPLSREEVAKDLLLEIKAGSSGRPNQAVELANMERGMPFLTMLPGVTPTPIARKYLTLLDIDVEDAITEGLPSIVAMNQMAGRSAQAGGDPQRDPNQQGGRGGQNTPSTQMDEPQPQPAFPAPQPQMA